MAAPDSEPTRKRVIDLNADLGEEVTDDGALLQIVTSANVACGYHAGSAAIMAAVCAEAANRGVSVGAQISYADRAGFGRVSLDVSYDVLRDQVADQIGTLSAIALAAGIRVRYLKPHGALYHRVVDDPEQAAAVLAGSGSLPVLGLAGDFASQLLDQAAAAGRRVLHEAFPDRAYDARGRLVARTEAGAVLQDADDIAAAAVRLAASDRPRVDSVCVHGDAPGAVEAARAVRTALEARGWRLRGL